MEIELIETTRNVFSEYSFLTEEDLNDLAKVSKIERIKKDENIVRSNEFDSDFIIVVNGLFRMLEMDEKGVEKSLLFIPENKAILHTDVTLNTISTNDLLIALEDSTIIRIAIKNFEQIGAKNIRILKLLNQELKKIVIDSVEQIKFSHLLGYEERYTFFLENFPDLEQRIKQKYLASYLGMTPSSLSRMKARILQNKKQ